MKRIGIIGGLSYESTLHYYEDINRQVNAHEGGLTSADLVLRSVNFEEYHKLMECENWDEIGRRLNGEILDLIFKNKCDYVAIASNTMHKVARPYAAADPTIYPSGAPFIKVPLVHIGDCIGEACVKAHAKTVLLLGTAFTMCDNFMIDYLRKNYGLCIINDMVQDWEVEKIDQIIFEELCHGIVSLASKGLLKEIILEIDIECAETGLAPGIDAVILGCTELGMLLEGKSVGITVIDSTKVHVDKLVELCLS